MGPLAYPRALVSRVPPSAGYSMLVGAVGVLLLAGLASQRLMAALTASAAVAVLAGLRRNRPERCTAWRLVALGLALCAVPGLAGRSMALAPVYVLGELIIVAALVLFLVDRRALPDRATAIDAAIIAVAFAALTWLYLVEPQGAAARANGIAPGVAAATSVFDFILVVLGALLVLGAARTCRAAHLLAVSVSGLIASHLLFLGFSMHGGHRTGGPEALAWLVFAGGLGAAALHPSMRRLAQRTARQGRALTPARLAVFAAASLLAPVVLIAHDVIGQERHLMLSVSSGVIFLLVLLRVGDLARVHQSLAERTLRTRFEARLGALVRNSSDAVCIVDADGALLYTSPAALAWSASAPPRPVRRSGGSTCIPTTSRRCAGSWPGSTRAPRAGSTTACAIATATGATSRRSRRICWTTAPSTASSSTRAT